MKYTILSQKEVKKVHPTLILMIISLILLILKSVFTQNLITYSLLLIHMVTTVLQLFCTPSKIIYKEYVIKLNDNITYEDLMDVFEFLEKYEENIYKVRSKK